MSFPICYGEILARQGRVSAAMAPDGCHPNTHPTPEVVMPQLSDAVVVLVLGVPVRGYLLSLSLEFPLKPLSVLTVPATVRPANHAACAEVPPVIAVAQ